MSGGVFGEWRRILKGTTPKQKQNKVLNLLSVQKLPSIKKQENLNSK